MLTKAHIESSRKMMDELISSLSQKTIELFKRDQYLKPVAFLINSDKILGILELKFETDEEKYNMYFRVGQVAKQLKADRVVMINDVALRTYTNKEEADYARQNYDHESPLCYPENMRQDGILLTDIKIGSKKIEACFLKYEKREEEIYFYDPQEIKSDFKVSLNGALVENILKGYEKL